MQRDAETIVKRLVVVLFTTLFLVGCGKTHNSSALKIGFVIKRPSEKWFKNELEGARKAAAEFGVRLLTAGGSDSEQALNAVNSLISRGVEGIVICTPEVKLGSAIKELTNRHGVKLFSVDDRFEQANGEYLEDIPYLGISVEQVGDLIAEYMMNELNQRNWLPGQSVLCTLSYDRLKTSNLRISNVIAGMKKRGFPVENIHMVNLPGIDQRHAYEAAIEELGKHPGVKNWLMCGFNDPCTIGAVRAMEAFGISRENGLAVGINGLDAARMFQKQGEGVLAASVLLNPYRHGYESVKMMVNWIRSGEVPPAETMTVGKIITRDNYKENLNYLYAEQEKFHSEGYVE